jgi:hypothetical protein
MKRRLPILFVIAALVSASVGCVVNLGGPALPPNPIPVSSDAAAQLEQEFQIAVENARNSQDGAVTLTVTEQELTSLLASKLQNQPDPFITDPQVYLQDNQIQIYGRAHRSIFTATAGITISAGVDAQGKPQLEVVAADFGPLPAPEGLINTITGFITEAYTSALGPVATGFRLQGIQIGNGQMILSGRLQ